MSEEGEETTVHRRVDPETESIDEEGRMRDDERGQTQTLPDIERGREKRSEEEGTLMREGMRERRRRLSQKLR